MLFSFNYDSENAQQTLLFKNYHILQKTITDIFHDLDKKVLSKKIERVISSSKIFFFLLKLR